MIHPKQSYLDLFQVGESQLDTLIAEALRHGGDYCDLYFENTTYGNLTLRDGIVNAAGRHIDYGVGIRVLCGEKTGYAYAESTAMPDMLACARAASAIADGTSAFYEHSVRAEANGSRLVGRRFRGEPNPAADRYPVGTHWRSTEASALIPFLKKLEQAVQARDGRIVKIIAMLAWQVTDVLMYNSLKELKYETRPMGTVSVTAIFQQDGKIENKSVSRSFRTGVEMLTDGLLEEMAAEVVHGIDERFAARRPKGGQMPEGNKLQVGYVGAVQDALISLHLDDVAFVKEVLKDDIELGFDTYLWYDYHKGFDFGGDVGEITDNLQHWAMWANNAVADVPVISEKLGAFADYAYSTRCEVVAGIEHCFLNWFPTTSLYYRNVASLNSQKVNDASETYITLVGFGGLDYVTFNYDDAEWAEYIKTPLVY